MINPEKLSILERTQRLVSEFVESYPLELVKKKPSEKAFSLTEIVYHLVDVEELWQQRFAEVTANESQVTFTAMDPDALAVSNRYNENDHRAGLRQWQELRSMTYEIVKNMPDEVLHRTAMHPRYGEMNVFRMFDIIANHDLQHLEQMKRTLNAVR
jgi:uncharacterized damage-inducible protein DinB